MTIQVSLIGGHGDQTNVNVGPDGRAHVQESGLISKSEAEAKIGAAYQQLLDSYPDCPAAAYAQSWMNNK